ncbi:hypothetical protein [Sporosarcina sp. P33]|uniref:hypothetical protein n=1 Tax=Sporosarcina sp. P33 TaxID=1930764 RepID=UPI0009C0B399|nr:hypothetical protein [Sporosarcina sp. P33]ARD47330.1 hypothetical protein SporoP33_03040 [Sporosarcina sp. P33]
MHKENQLPQSPREGILFMMIISIISVNTIAPIIMMLDQGFNTGNYLETLRIIPLLWVIIVLLVTLVAEPIVSKAMPTFATRTDGFNAHILLNTFLTVTVLSVCMSIIGPWVGMWKIGIEPFQNFFHNWFRNFGVAIWIELLIAQPIARYAMKKIHAKQASKTENVNI